MVVILLRYATKKSTLFPSPYTRASEPMARTRKDFLGTRHSLVSQFFFLTNLNILCVSIYIYIVCV
jgi:hypothetical protein